MNLNTHDDMEIAKSILLGCSTAAGNTNIYTERMIVEGAASRAMSLYCFDGKAAGFVMASFLHCIAKFSSESDEPIRKARMARYEILLDRAIKDAMEDSRAKEPENDISLTMLMTCKKNL